MGKFAEDRRNGIGGSDAAIIMGVSPWKSPLELWMEKTGRKREPDLDEVEYVKWGNRLEGAIADAYAEESGRKVELPEMKDGLAVAYWHKQHSWMYCHPDRLIPKAKGKKGRGVLEAKASASFMASHWDEEPPLMYQVQLQHNILTLGAKWGSLAVLLGGNMFRWMDMDLHKEFADALIEAEERFWWHVTNDAPPQPTGQEQDKTMLEQLYGKRLKKRPIELPEEALDWDRKRQEALATIEAAEKVKEEASNQIRMMLGNAQEGLLPTGDARYTWKYVDRQAYTVPAKKARELRRYRISKKKS